MKEQKEDGLELSEIDSKRTKEGSQMRPEIRVGNELYIDGILHAAITSDSFEELA